MVWPPIAGSYRRSGLVADLVNRCAATRYFCFVYHSIWASRDGDAARESRRASGNSTACTLSLWHPPIITVSYPLFSSLSIPFLLLFHALIFQERVRESQWSYPSEVFVPFPSETLSWISYRACLVPLRYHCKNMSISKKIGCNIILFSFIPLWILIHSRW